MKWLVPIAAFLVVQARVPALGQSNHRFPAFQPLEVSAQQEETLYCMDYPDVYTVFLKMRVTYTNTADRPVILRKDTLEVRKNPVALSLASAEKGEFVYNPSADDEVTDHPPARSTFGARPDDERFVVLHPGDSFSTDQWADLAASASAKTTNSGPRFGRDYVLQLYVETWPEEDESVAPLLTKIWQQWGRLQTGTLKSPFLPIRMPDLPRAAKSESCKGFSEKHGIPGY